MKALIKISTLIAASIIFAISCTNDTSTTDTQETSLQKYYSSRIADTAEHVVDSLMQNNIYKLTYIKGNSNIIETGDSIYFYYVGATFSNGFGSVFSTNIDSIATKFGYTDMIGKGEEKGIAGKGQYISGLEKGLLTMHEGEESYIFFESGEGFGDNKFGAVPSASPLIFDIYITKIKKN